MHKRILVYSNLPKINILRNKKTGYTKLDLQTECSVP